MILSILFIDNKHSEIYAKIESCVGLMQQGIFLFLFIMGNLLNASALLGEEYQFENQVNYSSELEVEYIGSSLWNGAESMVSDSKYIYCAMSAGLRIFKIGDDSSILLLSQIFLPNGATDLLKKGDLIYISSKTSGLQVIDVSDKKYPKIIGSYISDIGYSNIELDHNLLFLSHGKSILILGISNPSNPVYINSFQLNTVDIYNINCIRIKDNYAYIAAGQLHIYDISDPKNVNQVFQGDIINSTSPIDIEFDDGFAYMGFRSYFPLSQYNYIGRLDISNPVNPVLLTSYKYEGDCRSLTFDHSHIFVSAGLSGIIIFNKTHADTLDLVSCFREPGYFALNSSAVDDILVVAQTRNYPDYSDEYAYDNCGESPIVDNDRQKLKNQILVMDIVDIDEPRIISAFADPGIAFKCAVSGSYAYVYELSGGVTILDVSRPKSITKVSYMELPESSLGDLGINMSIEDNILFIAAAEQGIIIMDVANPYAPQLLCKYDTPGIAYDIQKNDEYLYIADGRYGIHILDISQPQLPIYLQSIPVDGMALEIRILGNFMFLASNSGGLQIYDICQKDSPKIISSILEGSYLIHNIAVNEYYAVVSGVGLACYIINLADIYNPILTNEILLDDIVYDLELYDDYLFIANSFAGLNIYTIDEDLSYEFVNNIRMQLFSIDIEITNHNIYLSNYHCFLNYAFTIQNNYSCPNYFNLNHNYPNPFNSVTIIPFEITQNCDVSLDIYNVLGQHVINLESDYFIPGYYSAEWNGASKYGNKVTSGIYLFVLRNEFHKEFKKMIYLK